MKSLSPNAQEFVPLVINNQMPAANSYYIINNGSPIAQQHHHPMTLQLGHVQFGYLNPNSGVINGSVSPIAAGAIVYMQPQVSTLPHHQHQHSSQYQKQITISSASPVNGTAAQQYPVYLSNGDGNGAVSMSPISNHFLVTSTNDATTLNARLNQGLTNKSITPRVSQNSAVFQPMNTVQQTQISQSHIITNNPFSSVQQPSQQNSHFAYQPGMINYMQSGQYPHSGNTFAYTPQYPQNLTSKGNHTKQSNTHNHKMNLHQHNINTNNNNHHLNANKIKAANSQNSFMTNNKQTLNNNYRTKETFDLTKNEKDWPQLNGTLKKNVKNSKQKKAPLEVEEENDEIVSDEEIDETVNVPQEKTPYLADVNQLKKLIKNVNFIKTTVEQHYLTENNLKQSNVNTNNHISVPVSFKDAVLAKPKPQPQPIKEAQIPIVKKIVENVSNIQKGADATPIVNSSSKTKRRSRRSRSKKNRSADDTRKSVERESLIVDFNLQNDEFPGLSDSVINKTLESKTNNFLKLFEKKLESSVDSTIINNKQTTEVKKDPSEISKNDPAKSSVKSNKPITLDFANMISALEKGQKREKPRNKLEQPGTNRNLIRSKSLASSRIGIVPIVPLTKSSHATAVNPLDSANIQKRGKEREKPKAKKQSTLKKIIIKEREEKRRLRQDQIKTIGSDELTLDIAGINSTIELILSPTHSTKNVDSTSLEIDVNAKTGDDEISTTDKSDLESNTNSPNKIKTQESSDRSDFGSDETNRNEPNEQLIQNEGEEEDDEGEDTEENENDGVMSNQMSPISQGSPLSIGGYSPSPYAAINGLLATDRTLLSLEKLEEQVKQKIHSRKFREYCNQIINREIDEVCNCLLHEIARFQDRLYHKNPTKAKIKRRYVMGIREVTKHLKLQKLKCIILAPNCEKIQSKGGLDDAINLIIQTSMEQNVPFVFALGRKALGKAVNKLVPISVVGIFDYSGAEEYFKRLVDLANNAKLAYQEMVEEYEKEECENLIVMQSLAVNSQADSLLNKEILSLPPTTSQTTSTNSILYNNAPYSTNPKVPSHMAHSRTSSNGSSISIEPYFMNYHTHSRSASGNFNYGSTTTNTGSLMTNSGNVGGHVRSASGGGAGTVFSNIDLGLHSTGKHWGTHSRTPSNCSNISFISRLSEPISEVGGSMGTLYVGAINNSNNNLTSYFPMNGANQNNNSNTINSAFVAVQYYNEQVRQEMNMCESEVTSMSSNTTVVATPFTKFNQDQTANAATDSASSTKIEATSGTATSIQSNTVGVNLHLGSINEIDAGNEADNEGENFSEMNESDNKHSKYSKKLNGITTADASFELNKLTTKLNLNENQNPTP